MICPGTHEVPAWQRSGYGDTVVCQSCLQKVTASFNAAGVLRIDAHDVRTSPATFVIVEHPAGRTVGRVWGNADGHAFGDRTHAEHMVRYLREHWPTEVVEGRRVGSPFRLAVFEVEPYQNAVAL